MIYQNLEGAMPPPPCSNSTVYGQKRSHSTHSILNKTTRSNTQNNAMGIGGLEGHYKKGTDIIFLQFSSTV